MIYFLSWEKKLCYEKKYNIIGKKREMIYINKLVKN